MTTSTKGVSRMIQLSLNAIELVAAGKRDADQVRFLTELLQAFKENRLTREDALIEWALTKISFGKIICDDLICSSEAEVVERVGLEAANRINELLAKHGLRIGSSRAEVVAKLGKVA